MMYHKDMFGVCLIQILVLGVMFATARTSSLPCFDENQLQEKAEKKLRYFDQIQPEPGSTTAQCPVGLYAGLVQHDLKDRSISPWRYVSQTEDNRYPQTIVVAQCLCSGCITIKREDNTPTQDFTYNSVTVEQSKTFLKKELCSDGKRYRLVPYTKPVAVGCTCANPKTLTQFNA